MTFFARGHDIPPLGPAPSGETLDGKQCALMGRFIMANRIRFWVIGALAIGSAGAVVVAARQGSGAENPPMLTEPKVVVAKSGAVKASGMVDCSADVLAQWPDYEGAPDIVLTNVSWTANQRKGRSVLSAVFEDHMASPCWARADAPDVDPGRCRLNDDGTQHPCTWDSQNYGSDGWIFGTGVFKTGSIHLAATMEGGYYYEPGNPEILDLGSFEMRGWDLAATKG